MTTFTLSLVDAKHLAAALIPHISTDDVTPVLTGAQVVGKYAVATDRYTVGRFDLTNMLVGTDELPEPLWIPRAALAWIKSIGFASLVDSAYINYRVRLTYIRHEKYEAEDLFRVEVMWRATKPEAEDETHLLRTFRTVGARGNFPPLARLYEGFIPGEVSVIGLGATHLDKFTTYARYVDRHQPIRVTFPAPSTTTKLQPLLIEIGNRFKGLLQQNLIVNHEAFGHDLAAANLAAHVEAERQRADSKSAETTEGGE